LYSQFSSVCQGPYIIQVGQLPHIPETMLVGNELPPFGCWFSVQKEALNVECQLKNLCHLLLWSNREHRSMDLKRLQMPVALAKSHTIASKWHGQRFEQQWKNYLRLAAKKRQFKRWKFGNNGSMQLYMRKWFKELGNIQTIEGYIFINIRTRTETQWINQFISSFPRKNFQRALRQEKFQKRYACKIFIMDRLSRDGKIFDQKNYRRKPKVKNIDENRRNPFSSPSPIPFKIPDLRGSTKRFKDDHKQSSEKETGTVSKVDTFEPKQYKDRNREVFQEKEEIKEAAPPKRTVPPMRQSPSPKPEPQPKNRWQSTQQKVNAKMKVRGGQISK